MRVASSILALICFSALCKPFIERVNIQIAHPNAQALGWTPIPQKCEFEENKKAYSFTNDAPIISQAGIAYANKMQHSCTS